MNRRALLIALILAMASATILMLYMRRFEQEMSGGERISLLTLAKPVERGTILTEEMLSSRSVPIAYIEERSIKVAEKSKVLGLKTSVDLQSQQTLMWTDLAISDDDRDLSSLVQPGKRGVIVRAMGASDNQGNALIRPGDYVDVIVTMEEKGESNKEPKQTSVVLLQKILVLAVGLETRASGSGAETERGKNRNEWRALTLSLSLPEAQLLGLAVERGVLSVAVRNPDDQRVVEGVPDLKSGVLLDTIKRETIQRRPTSMNESNRPKRLGSN